MSPAQIDSDTVVVLHPARPRVLEELDHSARLTFVEIGSPAEDNPNLLDLLEKSARFLDQRRAMAGIAEALHMSGISSYSSLNARAAEVLTLARRLTRLDPVAVLLSDASFVELARRTAPSKRRDELPSGYFESLVRAVRSLLEVCPIHDLVRIGEAVNRQDLGHRCRLSYDWLQAFARRNASQDNAARHVAGRLYAEGTLSLDEAASLLLLPQWDVVAWFEEHGYARDLDVIRLQETERASRLDRVRSNRLKRGGQPVVDLALVAKEVVATQRIEDVDARPWVPLPPQS